MGCRRDLVEDPELRRDKAVGCLSGLAIGDTLGELARSEEYHERYGITVGLSDSSESTDDTEFALLTAKSLISSGGNLTIEHVYDSWMEYIVLSDGIDGGVKRKSGSVLHGAAANLRRGMKPPFSGSDNCNTYDDGAAMRVAPIGILCAGEPERAAKLADIDAQISHCDDGVWGAQAIAASIAAAMVSETIDEIVRVGLKQIPEDSWLGRSCKRAMEICDEEKTLRNAWERLHDELWTVYRASCPEAIAQTYAIFRLVAHRGFVDTVVAGANFGRDADTIAAILGALAGAMQGASSIPPRWIEATRRPRGISLAFAATEDVVEVASQLAELID
jgi:ADP-ribosylglycohydrolase